jgi:tellurite resistance protein
VGLLTDHTALEVTAPGDAAALRDVLSLIGSIDGSVDAQERAVIEAFFKTIPQLRDEHMNVPPRTSRDAILTSLQKLTSARLQRQCFVLAVELAMASGGVNQAEDAWLTALRAALGIDDAFAAGVVQVLACKYAREPTS